MGLAKYLTRIIQLALFAVFSIQASADAFPKLRDRHDPDLQRQVVSSLYRLGLKDAIRHGRLAVALVDITDLENPRVAAVNGDQMIYAASLPKIAILLGVFAHIEQGKLKLTHTLRQSLIQMIRYSSNVEATRMLNLVGKDELIRILESDRYHRLYDPSVNGGLWVGKEYARGVAYSRDPLHNLSHGATVMQVARFYYLLETGRLLTSRKLCREMKDIMGRPGINHKFVKGLAERRGVRVFRKSGTWSRWHADSAIVEAGDHRYILVALAQDARGGQWLVNLAKPLNDIVVPPRTRLLLARADDARRARAANAVPVRAVAAAAGRRPEYLIPAHLRDLPLVEKRKDAWPASARGEDILAWALF